MVRDISADFSYTKRRILAAVYSATGQTTSPTFRYPFQFARGAMKQPGRPRTRPKSNNDGRQRRPSPDLSERNKSNNRKRRPDQPQKYASAESHLNLPRIAAITTPVQCLRSERSGGANLGADKAGNHRARVL